MQYDGYKLIRDKLPQVIGNDGVLDRVLDRKSYSLLLSKKLEEETQELHEAMASGDRAAIENEMADVHEVLMAIADFHRCRDVVDLASEKCARLGGFYGGHVLKIG